MAFVVLTVCGAEYRIFLALRKLLQRGSADGMIQGSFYQFVLG